MKRGAAVALLCVTLSSSPLVAGVQGLLARQSSGAADSVTTLSAGEAQRLFASGLYQKAAQALQSAISQKPGDASLQYWLGRCFFEMSDYNSASASFERAVALQPGSSEYHDWLGRASGRKAEQTNRFSAITAFTLARKTHREFETAVSLDPRNLEAQRDLIRYLLNAPGIVGGGEQRAEQQIQALSKIDPVEGSLAQAEAFITHNKFDEAAREYQKVLDAGPQRIGVYFEVAGFYQDRGDGQAMKRVIEEGAPLAPLEGRLNYYRGVALVLTREDPAEAEKFLRAYLDAEPNNTELPSLSSAHDWLGRLYENQHDAAKAAEEYQAALALDPHDKISRDALKRLQK